MSGPTGAGRIEIDGLREQFIELHKANWRFLDVAAGSYLNDPFHFGVIVAGKFHRGPQREGGRYVEISERDRVRALQLMVQALDSARKDPDRPAAGRFLHAMAGALLSGRDGGDAWRLQSLTALDALPDYDEWRSGWSEQSPGAPVGPDGPPVYYRVPASFEKAKNDGERVAVGARQAAEADPGQLNSGRIELANFLLGQFGTQTMADEAWTVPADGSDGNQAGPYALETLRDDETIARLATGVKRFTLPDVFNPIKIYQTDRRRPEDGHGEDALDRPGDHLREPPPVRPGGRDTSSGARRSTATGRRLEAPAA